MFIIYLSFINRKISQFQSNHWFGCFFTWRVLSFLIVFESQCSSNWLKWCHCLTKSFLFVWRHQSEILCNQVLVQVLRRWQTSMRHLFIIFLGFISLTNPLDPNGSIYEPPKKNIIYEETALHADMKFYIDLEGIALWIQRDPSMDPPQKKLVDEKTASHTAMKFAWS